MTAVALSRTSRSVTALWGLAGATATVVVVELSVLRVFTRTVVHIPGARDAAPGLSAVSDLGRMAFYLASVLLVITIALAVRQLASTNAVVETLALGSVVLLAAVAVGRRVDLVASSAADAGVIVAVLVAGACAATGVEARARIPIVAFAIASALGGLAMLVGSSAVRADLRAAVEVTAVVAIASMPLAAPKRPDRFSLVVGVIAAIAAWGALTANGTTPRILMLWNFGLAGTLPEVIYGVAVGSLVTALMWCWRAGERRRLVGLVLMIIGGIGLHSTYQSALAVTGLGLLLIAGPLGSPVRKREDSSVRR